MYHDVKFNLFAISLFKFFLGFFPLATHICLANTEESLQLYMSLCQSCEKIVINGIGKKNLEKNLLVMHNILMNW